MAPPSIQGQSQSSSKVLPGYLYPHLLTSLTSCESSSFSLGSSHTGLFNVSLTYQACFYLRAMPLQFPLPRTLFPQIPTKATLSPLSSLCLNIFSMSSPLTTHLQSQPISIPRPFSSPHPTLSLVYSIGCITFHCTLWYVGLLCILQVCLPQIECEHQGSLFCSHYT